MTNTTADEILTEDEAAEVLKVTPDRMYRMRRDGVGPRYQRCGSGRRSPVRYHRKHLIDWMLRGAS